MERLWGTGLRAACLAAVVALIASCTFSTPDTTPLAISAPAELSDTMDLWPALVFPLSAPVVESYASLRLLPDYQGLYVSTLRGADSIVFSVTDPSGLPGSTIFALELAGDLHAANGSLLSAAATRFTFVTRPAEREPNGAPALADTLFRSICASLSPVSDTDYFYCSAPAGQTLALKNILGSVLVVTVDSLGTLSPAPIIGSAATAYPFPASTGPTVLAVINGGFGLARYRLTLGNAL